MSPFRSGPGRWYPIKWVIKKPSLPIKIIDENEDFLFALLHDGTKYWIYKDLTDNNHNLIVIEDTVIKNKKGKVIAKVLKDVIIKEHNCSEKKDTNLCKVIQHDKNAVEFATRMCIEHFASTMRDVASFFADAHVFLCKWFS